jgi:L-ascorbate metabolism protein UlaG (beta-lactamase superfamily)
MWWQRIAIGVLFTFLCLVLLVFGIQAYLAVPGYQGARSNHFDGKQFRNSTSYAQKTVWTILDWRLHRKVLPWPQWVKHRAYAPPHKRVTEPKAVSVTFINHATVLIQADGLNILTDPIWSERPSPFRGIGPKRVRAPGLSLAALPPIDLVLISHNHYDHMDLPTLKALQKRFHPLIVTGLGNDLFLKAQGFHRVKALDWWQSFVFKGHRVYVLPSQHFSGRSLGDRMNTLWGSFAVKTSSGWVYVAGDTGFSKHFHLIKQRLGSVFLALLPIGAYLPRAIMKPVHLDPDDAVKAFQALHARYAVGMHFDTFVGLADEPFGDAPKRLHRALQHHHLAYDRFLALGFGQTKRFYVAT